MIDVNSESVTNTNHFEEILKKRKLDSFLFLLEKN